VRRDFSTYHDFASSSLDEIYKPDDLASALHLTANTFQSGIYRNNGDGTFTWQDLPFEVQRSPSYGCVPIDLDADGVLDLAISQNFFTMQSETGLMRGGLGVVLRGNGDGTFQPMPPTESGVVVFGDGKGLAVLDADHDGRPDLLAMQNNDTPVLMTQAGNPGRRYLAVRLTGAPGNPAALGAVVTATYADGRTQTRTLGARGGYLSQSTATLHFGSPAQNPVQAVTIAWPTGGGVSQVDIDPDTSLVTPHHPALDE